MSLFRYSIYPKLLSCIGAAAWIEQLMMKTRRWKSLPIALLWTLALVGFLFVLTSSRAGLQANLAPAALLLCIMSFLLIYDLIGETRAAPLWCASLLIPLTLITLVAGWRHAMLGLRVLPTGADPPDYLAVCRYARDHTPIDAVFVVPPNEQEFRLEARRAIVINFKGVPQFSGELGDWSKRLAHVLDLPDLHSLPHRFDRTLDAIGQRYDDLSAEHFWSTARRFEARYVVTTRAVSFPAPAKLIFESGPYHLYDLLP